MFRTTASRAVPRSLPSRNVAVSRNSVASKVLRASLKTSVRSESLSRPLALALREPLKRSVVRYQSGTAYQAANFVKGLSKEAEKGYGEEKIAPVPDQVSTESTIHPVQGEVGMPAEEQDVDMMAGIRSDFVSQTTHRDVNGGD